jgi:hypothetical protein
VKLGFDTLYNLDTLIHIRKDKKGKMSKVVKVNHVVLTLALNSAAIQVGGETQANIDAKINLRLAEGYDDVEVIPLRTNFDERQQPTHVVNQYIFKKYAEDDVAEVKKSKKEKEKEPVVA